MTLSKLDKFYRSILLSRYFVKGWGNAKSLKKLLQFRKIVANRETCYQLVQPDYPVNIVKEYHCNKYYIVEGSFLSPFEVYMPDLLPEEAKKAYFQLILPTEWLTNLDIKFKPIVLHMAGTGDHYFWRRRHLVAKPLLLEAGIGSVLLENPFYGSRKPNNQVRSILHNVSDIFVMGGCLILEALVLFHWCTRQGLGPLGVTGISMGGHMASLAATNWPKPIVLVPCLSWSTASPVFTEGVMSEAVNWDMLQEQYRENVMLRSQVQKMVRIIGVDAFEAGKEFVKSFPDPVQETISPEMTTHVEETLNLKNQGSGTMVTTNLDLKQSQDKGSSGRFRFSLKKSMWLKSSSSKHEVEKHEALQFMRGIMDECTHLKNFSVPVDTSLITIICARDDGYVPREGVTHLTDIWPGAEVKYLNAGHVSAFILHQKVFRKAIIDCFERYKRKYMNKQDSCLN